MSQATKTLLRNRVDLSPTASWPVCTSDELAAILAEGGPSLVEFWAPDCLFSRLLMPIRVQLRVSHGNQLRLLCCALDSVTTGAAAYGATALPALVLFDGTKRLRRWLGATDPALLQHQINAALADVVA